MFVIYRGKASPFIKLERKVRAEEYSGHAELINRDIHPETTSVSWEAFEPGGSRKDRAEREG